MKNNIFWVLFVFVLGLLMNILEAQIIVMEQATIITTYEVKEEDPDPIFNNRRGYQGAQGRVYSYPLLHNLTSNKVDQDCQELILENDYLKISILRNREEIFTALRIF